MEIYTRAKSPFPFNHGFDVERIHSRVVEMKEEKNTFHLTALLLTASLVGCGGQLKDSGEGAHQDSAEESSEDSGQAEEAWHFEAHGALGISGVGIGALAVGEELLLYVTGMGGAGGPSQLQIYRSADGAVFEEAEGDLPQGSDPSPVALRNGESRLYYTEPEFDMDGIWWNDPKGISAAGSSDGLEWLEEGGTGVESRHAGRMTLMDHPPEEAGSKLYRRICDGFMASSAVLAPEGGVRIYVLDGITGCAGLNPAFTGHSEDGLLFGELQRTQIGGGDCDDPMFGCLVSEVFRAEAGGWLGLVEGAGPGGGTSLYLARSEDGIRWTAEADPLVRGEEGVSVFDAAVAPGEGGYHLYYCLGEIDFGANVLLYSEVHGGWLEAE
jgi:hypothetical protein